MAKYLSPEAKKKRARRRRAKRLALMAFLASSILLFSYGIVAVIEAISPQHQTSQPNADSLISESQPTTDLEPNSSLESDGKWSKDMGPVQQTINNFEVIAPDHRMIQLPENGSVDMSYFSDAVFVGDSLTDGLRIYTGIENSVAEVAQFVCAESLSPKSFIDGIITNFEHLPDQNGVEAIVATNPKKLYITLGTNALVSQSHEQVIYYYDKLLDILMERLPDDTLIYVCSVTPTTASYAAQRPNFAWDKMYAINNQIAKMCNEKGLYYVNLHEALAEDDGYLAEENSGDGIHLKPDMYSKWVQYLMTHTVHRPDNPYIIGSPYYVG
ncbi:MAG: hypothetical protein IIV99_07095 [Oscillospiraceae bacterium]|nr:hypothetical protein [Oscillospiraceae bacterium]